MNAPLPAAGITIERVFKAPPEKVWRMWTTESGLAAWWGPDGFACTVRRLDFRVDGSFEIAMRATAPQQVDYLRAHGIPLDSVATGVYTAIDPTRHLAWRNVVDFVPGVPRYEVLAGVTLEPTEGGDTAMTFTSGRMHDAMWTRNAEMGWTQQVDRLLAQLAAGD
ncbi:MAG: SRPBCC domain-containing protein [Pseudomonadota bacterium]|nr:SRPBCC domain-containing protein [Pseudomonadota bacterium]